MNDKIFISQTYKKYNSIAQSNISTYVEEIKSMIEEIKSQQKNEKHL